MLRGNATLSWIVVSLLPTWAAAQDTAKKVPPKPATVEVAFEGGTLATYVEVLRKQFPNANIDVDGPVAVACAERTKCASVLMRGSEFFRPDFAEPSKAFTARQRLGTFFLGEYRVSYEELRRALCPSRADPRFLT